MKIVHWRNELPPLSEKLEGEHVVEARSQAVPNSAEHDHLWKLCYESLIAAAAERIEQEVRRLGGSCAHVVDEKIEPKTNHHTGEYWLTGRFLYVMYQHEIPASAPRSAT